MLNDYGAYSKFTAAWDSLQNKLYLKELVTAGNFMRDLVVVVVELYSSHSGILVVTAAGLREREVNWKET